MEWTIWIDLIILTSFKGAAFRLLNDESKSGYSQMTHTPETLMQIVNRYAIAKIERTFCYKMPLFQNSFLVSN